MSPTSPACLLAAFEEDLRRGLAHLQAAEFLYEVSLFPDLEYTFKHALTHEVAYGGLLHERRRSIHARIVEVIEALHADRLAEHVERLASHALRGEQWTKAVRYAGDAGRKAGGLAEDRGMRPLAARIHLALGKVYRRADKRQQAQEHLTTATTMYREMDMRFWLEQAEVEMNALE